MTIAVCIFCGSVKHGAFTACSNCANKPESEVDKANSMALSDHFVDLNVLKDLGARIAAGVEMSMDPSTLEATCKTIREEGQTRSPFGFLRKALGHEDRGPSPRTMWAVNIEGIYDSKVQLRGADIDIELQEIEFCAILAVAKKAGWTGGDRFFQEYKGARILKEVENGWSVVGEEAKGLGRAYAKYIRDKSPKPNARFDASAFCQPFVTLCQEGGFRVTGVRHAK